jgi:hypothetical protein
MGECVNGFMRKPIMTLSIAKRMITNRMPNSINEKAQSSMEPKAMGVNINRKIRMNLIRLLNMAQSSALFMR